MTPPHSLVNLYAYEGLGLILKMPSAVCFSNQCAGTGCFHPEVEGVLIPLPEKLDKSETKALESFFPGDWSTLAELEVESFNALLNTIGLDFLATDEAELENSYEAWVHVLVDASRQPYAGDRTAATFDGFRSERGVLTWQNSD